MRYTAAVVVALILGVMAATPAYAGNWALTVLDPLPEQIVAGQTYTVGYWVLQHGFHPYEPGGPDDALGTTGFRLVAGSGETVTYPGVALAEPAHFAAPLVVPADGRWELIALQGRFAEHHVGTLTVPGGLALSPLPQAVAGPDGRSYWGAVRPPLELLRERPVDVGFVVQPPAAAPRPAPASDRGPELLAAGAIVGVLTGGGMVLLRRRRAGS